MRESKSNKHFFFFTFFFIPWKICNLFWAHESAADTQTQPNGEKKNKVIFHFNKLKSQNENWSSRGMNLEWGATETEPAALVCISNLFLV